MHPIECRGCRRVIGYIPGEINKVMYCTPHCAEDYPVSDNESRDDLIAALARRGKSRRVIAEQFGITRQRASQIAGHRNFNGDQ